MDLLKFISGIIRPVMDDALNIEEFAALFHFRKYEKGSYFIRELYKISAIQFTKKIIESVC